MDHPTYVSERAQARTRWRPHLPHLPQLGAAAHDVARRDDISWVSLLRTARVSYAFQVFVAAGLLLPSQMRDMLVALSESHAWRAQAAFPASMAVFGFLSWYWARAALSARFDLPDTKRCWDDALGAGQDGHRPFIRKAPLHIVPQAPIPIAGVTGFLLALQSGATGLGIATLCCLLAVWYGVDRRRDIRAVLRRVFLPNHVFPDEQLPPETQRLRSTYSVRLWLRRVPFRFYKILQRAPSGVWPASALLIVSMLVFAITAAASFFPAQHLHDVRNLIWTFWHGPTPVLLGCALMVGPFTVLSFVLDGLRLSVWFRDAPFGLSRPPVIAGLLAASLLAPNFSALHALRVAPGPLPRRPTLAAHWHAWQDRCGHATRPVVVAISGGAARAALWGAAVLAEIDRMAEGRPAAIYAISSVSGGSLGAAIYLSARGAAPAGAAGNPAFCRLAGPLQAPFETYAKQAIAADAIGPLLAGFVLSDVPRGFFGWLPAMVGAPMRGGDRAAAIERAFEANAAHASHRARLHTVPLDAPYLALATPGMPLWTGLATERDTGGRVLIIPVRGAGGTEWPFEGAADLLAQLGADVPISTAANATSRFPFLLPSAAAPSRQFMHQGLALIDGGYYDQSGLETALELAEWLRRQGADPIVVQATGSGYGNGLDTGSPMAASDEIIRCGTTAFRPDEPPITSMAADVLAPLVGLYQARAGHVDALLRRARSAWCGPHQSFFHFYLGARGAEPVPLNWVLSDGMADHVWRSAGDQDLNGETQDAIIAGNRAEGTRLAARLGE
jgi:hypothetical protein